MKKHTPEFNLSLLPQDAVKARFMDEPGLNAAWDYHISPAGRHFIPACDEGGGAGYAKLYEYLPQTNEMKRCFAIQDSIVVYDRTIRPSKFHTCICSMPDGRLIMQTHTTAKAPAHPGWLVEPYYEHPWEGFMGSNILIYDPDTGKLEDLGIPVPRESMYGGCYEPKHNCYYMSGYTRGHIYRFDLDTRDVTDYGQCADWGVYYLKMGPDGNIYFISRSGSLWKIDTDTQEVMWTGIDVPRVSEEGYMSGNPFCHVETGPDGRMYFYTYHRTRFMAYDIKTNTLEMLGQIAPKAMREAHPGGIAAMAMAFDKEGMLWYVAGYNGYHLCRINVMDPNAEAEAFGLVGISDRTMFCAEKSYIIDDVFYIADTNHSVDTSAGIYAIDLAKVREITDETPREICQDIQLYVDSAGNLINREFYKGDLEKDSEKRRSEIAEGGVDAKAWVVNDWFFYKNRVFGNCLWKKFGTKGSQAVGVAYNEDGSVRVYIEANGGLCVTVKDGFILSWEPCRDLPYKDAEAIEKQFEQYKLPAYPGRQYLAVASASAALGDGSVIVGTKDGMLARIRDGKVFGLGSIVNGGAVHDLAASPDGKTVWGVAGDPDGLGMVFSYSNEEGLVLRGQTRYHDRVKNPIHWSVSCEPCCIAVSPDGREVAIGVRDNLGYVWQVEI